MNLARYLSTHLPNLPRAQHTLIVEGGIAEVFSLAPSAHPAHLPVVTSLAECGFPSPADDYVDRQISFDDLLLANPAATFIVRAAGDSMIQAGIAPGDLLVVDRSTRARDRHIVVAIVEGEQTVKYLRVFANGVVRLDPANPAYQSITITSETDFEVWGVVRFVVKKTD